MKEKLFLVFFWAFVEAYYLVDPYTVHWRRNFSLVWLYSGQNIEELLGIKQYSCYMCKETYYQEREPW